MTDKINDGGPAFPRVTSTLEENGDRMHCGSNGMTLRDYFASKAMQAMSTGGVWPDSIERPEIAKRAYALADDMLAAREGL